LAKTFNCSLVTPERLMLDKQVTYADIPVWDGQMGLQAGHSPVLAKLGDGVLRIDYADGASDWYFVGGGFAQMKDNKLTVLTSDAIKSDEVVRADAEKLLTEANTRQAKTVEELDKKQRAIHKANAMLAIIRLASA
jgi:F-type H+-transporting ATPase subunit epsilon